jgi:threonine/homoserine/homoserine lactone efflux protein
LRAKEQVDPAREIPKASLSRVFYQGAVVNLLNPKTALFFFAFMPQLIDPARGRITLQIILFGAILIVLGTLSDSIYAIAAGGVGAWLRGNPKFLRAQRYFAGAVYLVLGIATALSGLGAGQRR